MLINTWKFHLLNWQRGASGEVYLRLFCLHWITCLNIPTVRRALSYILLMSSLLLAFCFLLVFMVDQIQMYPSSISPLGLFQEIVCNIHNVNFSAYL